MRHLRQYVPLFAAPATLALVLLTGACTGYRSEPIDPAALDTLAYVGRVTCERCHAEVAATWTGSDHDLAMDEATPETVLGDFSGAEFRNCGVTTRFYRRGDAFFVSTDGPDGRVGDFQVRYTFGVRPLQQYLVAFPDGRVQALTIAWDVAENRWFSLYPDECVPHDDWLHWTKGGMNWNYMCADCHSTNLRRNFQVATDEYQTSYSEIDVSCEACHGPGELHLEWAEGERVHRTPGGDGLVADISREAPARQEVETCAPCHSRRGVAYPDFLAGRPYLDHYEPVLLEEALYFPDGQIKDEVYVYGSFLQSKMHQQGVRCSDCHDPHSTRIRFEGNALCTQCHDAPAYDVPGHLRHEAGTAGSGCIDCHMPQRTYMVVDPRRDHSFKVPRPDLTVDLGVPNACTGCHESEEAAWAADSVRAWYGPERVGTPEFAHAFEGGRRGTPDAEPALRGIVADTTRPGIVRASALFLLRTYDSVATEDLGRAALADADPLVRTTAIRNVEETVPAARLAVLLDPLLADETRLVRMEAARVLARVAGTRYAPATGEKSPFWEALEEYREGQLSLSDQAAAHLNLAITQEGVGDLRKAQEAYETALRLDSSFVPAHANVAMLYNRLRTEALSAGRASEAEGYYASAETALRRAVTLAPQQAETHYTLGLLLAENPERLPEAAEHLARAAALDPEDPRVQYNAGLAFQRLERPGPAEAHLLAAHRLAPEHPDYLNALSIFYVQQERWEDATLFTEMLAAQFPQDPSVHRRLAFIRAQEER